METANNIIKNKIDSVTDLPEGYAPNLNSKWELLQAGLPQQPEKEQRKPVLFYMQRAAAVAAMLLMIGGSWIIIVRKPQSEKPIVATKTSIKAKSMVASFKPLQPITKGKNKKHKATSANIITACENILDENLLDTNIPKPLEIILPVAIVNEKPEHFTEMDFNEPVIKNTPPTEVYVKAQRFKFKLGVGEAQGLNAANGKPNALGFRTSF